MGEFSGGNSATIFDNGPIETDILDGNSANTFENEARNSAIFNTFDNGARNCANTYCDNGTNETDSLGVDNVKRSERTVRIKPDGIELDGLGWDQGVRTLLPTWCRRTQSPIVNRVTRCMEEPRNVVYEEILFKQIIRHHQFLLDIKIKVIG